MRIEEWFAEQSTSYPVSAINLYKKLVEGVENNNWSSIARTSETKNRSQLYENAEDTGKNSLEIAMKIADRFAADNQMDRDFMDNNLPQK